MDVLHLSIVLQNEQVELDRLPIVKQIFERLSISTMWYPENSCYNLSATINSNFLQKLLDESWKNNASKGFASWV